MPSLLQLCDNPDPAAAALPVLPCRLVATAAALEAAAEATIAAAARFRRLAVLPSMPSARRLLRIPVRPTCVDLFDNWNNKI